MISRSRRTAALALALAAVIASPGAAHAATASTADNAHDGNSSAEITHFRLTNGATTIVATIRYATYDPARASSFVDLMKIGRSTSAKYAAGRKAGGGKFMVEFGPNDATAPVSCPGLKVAVLHSPTRVRIAIPQRCLRVHGTVTALGGSEGGTNGDIDFSPSVRAARG